MIRPKMSIVLVVAVAFGYLFLVRNRMQTSSKYVKIEVTKEGAFVSATEPKPISGFDPFFVRENCFEKLKN